MMTAGHAAMHESAARQFEGSGWRAAAEATFSIYGERGVRHPGVSSAEGPFCHGAL